MRVPKEKPQMPPVHPQPASYCVCDAQGTILHRIETYGEGSQLRLHHFAALAHFFNTTERFDRLHALLTEWFIHDLNQSHGVWAHEQEDLLDLGQLLDFLSRCHRPPTPVELDGLLRR